MSDEHIPHVQDDQESPYWSIRCSCGWRSGACRELDAAVESYGEHTAHRAAAITISRDVPYLLNRVRAAERLIGAQQDYRLARLRFWAMRTREATESYDRARDLNDGALRAWAELLKPEVTAALSTQLAGRPAEEVERDG